MIRERFSKSMVEVTCGVFFAATLLAGNLAAEEQVITPAPLISSAAAGEPVSLEVFYDTLPQDATLTGIGIRVHYDSSKLGYDQVTETLAFGRLFDPALVEPQQDSSDFDGDPATDFFLSLAWVDFGGNWPGALPQKLARVNFVAAGDFSKSTLVRFSASDLASGYTFSSESATINPPVTRTLSVTRSGTGSGTVTSVPAGIDCGSDCSEGYPQDTEVSLTASADAGSEFSSWGGACSGTNLTTAVTMNADQTCDAVFNADIPNTYSIGGTLSGLADGSEVILQNNGGDDLTLSDNGLFTFATTINAGAPYLVTVLAQPANPPQSCTVTNGDGIVGNENVTNVTVNCSERLEIIFIDGFE